MEDNKTIGIRLKEIRTSHNLSGEELANKLGYSRQYINQVENGKAPGRKFLRKVCDEFNVDMDYLVGRSDEKRKIDLQGLYSAGYQSGLLEALKNAFPVPDLSGIRKIPIYGTIACGNPIQANREYEYAEVDSFCKADFCLRAEGDSMKDCGILSGSLVLCKNAEEVENGQIAAVLIDGEATLKKFYNYGTTVVLRPCNPAYDELIYQNDDLNQIRVIGKAIGCLNFLN